MLTKYEIEEDEEKIETKKEKTTYEIKRPRLARGGIVQSNFDTSTWIMNEPIYRIPF